MAYTWMPAALERILEPFLQAHPETEERVRAALDAIARSPYKPGNDYVVRDYKGSELPNAYIVPLQDVWICYQVMRDMPLLLLVNVLHMSRP
jgi:hypothetical protein